MSLAEEGRIEAPQIALAQGRYRLAFATTPEEVDAALKLRFEVFNRELGEGLTESWETGLDRDAFDDVCHHLVVDDVKSGEVIGTYRIQTGEMAAAGEGFYSDDEFHLSDLGKTLLDGAIEAGRACIERRHRNRQVLFLLWRGLAAYMSTFEKRYLFGCCSLTSQDPAEGLALYSQLVGRGLQLESSPVRARVALACEADAAAVDAVGEVSVPTLFATYLRYGAKVCGPPVIDRRFKTIDFLVLLDVETLDEGTRRLFFD